MKNDSGGWFSKKENPIVTEKPKSRIHSLYYYDRNEDRTPVIIINFTRVYNDGSIGISHDERVLLRESNFFGEIQKFSKNELRYIYEKLIEIKNNYETKDDVPIYFNNILSWFVNDCKILGLTLREV